MDYRELLLGFLVCRFSGESLACVGDDGAVGIIFLPEGITMRTSTCSNMQGQIQVKTGTNTLVRVAVAF